MNNPALTNITWLNNSRDFSNNSWNNQYKKNTKRSMLFGTSSFDTDASSQEKSGYLQIHINLSKATSYTHIKTTKMTMTIEALFIRSS